MRSAENFERALEKARFDALLVTTDPLLFAVRDGILASVAATGLPAMFGLREYPDAVGLVS